MSVKDIPANVFIGELAKQFKQNPQIEVPQWADVVKTASFKELAPTNEDWFYIRLAAIARRLYINGGIGVTKFTQLFGGSATYGVRRKHAATAAPAPISKALQQLEKIGLVAKVNEQGKEAKGRFLTAQGRKTLDLLAKTLAKKRLNYGLNLTPTM